MKRLVKLGIEIEVNGGDADPKQKVNTSLHGIVVTTLVRTKEKLPIV